MGARAEISFEVGLVGGAVDSVEDFGWGYFIPNTSPPTSEFEFRTKEVQRDGHSRNRPLESRTLPPPDILALNVRVLESFRIRAVQGDASKFP